MGLNYNNINEVDWILENNKAISLLKKDNASLIVSFLFSAFKSRNKTNYYSSEITSLLSDFIYQINIEKSRFPKDAKYYLETWTKDGFLRQYYDKSDEAIFELTPSTENALRWLTELNKPEFVGTESRLLQIFDLLNELATKSTDDIDLRKKQLQNEKAKIDRELQKIESGIYEKYDQRKIVEQFLFLEEIIGKLLSDFRQTEENFRTLNLKAREDQIKKTQSKGKFIEEVFRTQDLILETDQGKSFKAFYEFLMNPQKQNDLEELTQRILSLGELTSYKRNNQLELLKENLIESGEKVNRTTNLLIEQLRKFLDSKHYLENRKIADIIEGIEKMALDIRNSPPTEKDFLEIDDKPHFNFSMEQKLWEPVKKAKLSTDAIESADDEIDIDAMFKQQYIDPEVLKDRIKLMLKGKKQISLKDIVSEIPIEKGLTEVIAYFSIATNYEKKSRAVINEETKETIEYSNNGRLAKVDLPQTIFLA